MASPWKIKILLISVVAFSLIGFATNFKSASSILPTSSINSQNVGKDLAEEGTPSILHHPFENKCKFAMINAYANDIAGNWRIGERMRQLNCPTDYPMATQDFEGAIYVHPHFTHYPNKTETVNCKVEMFEGGLRDPNTNKGKDDFTTVATSDAPLNTRFIVNADAFRIKCLDGNKTTLWQKVFAGMYDTNKPKNTVINIPDTPNFDNYGRKMYKKVQAKVVDRLSVDILGCDSTSRTMFQRHMPRTWETMHRLGFEVLYGYNKVGDNSMVNLAPILAGDVKEAMESPKLDDSGDINSQWILPSDKKMDPTSLPFLWKMMKEKFGCKSMLNEDISMKALGLFHYPGKEFLPGFTKPPADHFYRAFYLAVYNDWKYGPCRDGDQVQKQFVDLWHRFASNYKDICHFGFSFITTLTHETATLIEVLDEHVTKRLENLYLTGALDNSVSIILGDHGNRIGAIQYAYSGRVEERMPLMAIRIPDMIKKEYPKQYEQFQKNKYKLTSNFDVHQMLKDIANMQFGDDRTRDGSRGISLFREIPDDRTCFDAYVPENFCSCLVDRNNLTVTTGGQAPKSPVHRKSKILLAVRSWISENGLDKCLNSSTLPTDFKIDTLGLNPLARHGFRNKGNATLVANSRKAPPKMEYLFHEVILPISLISPTIELSFLFRVDDDINLDKFAVVFEPSVQQPPRDCPFKSVFDVCDCLTK